MKRKKHNRDQKKERLPIEKEFVKLNLINEIFNSGLINKLIEITKNKTINLNFADNLNLSSIKPIKKRENKEKIKMNVDKDPRKLKILNVFG